MKSLLTAAVVLFGMSGAAHAAVQTFTGVIPGTSTPTSIGIDTNGAPSSVTWAQSTGVGPHPAVAGAHVTELENNLNLSDPVELSGNNANEKILKIQFSQPLVNGAGYDLLIFETFNQSDSPTFSLEIFGTRLEGVALLDNKDQDFRIWAFDFSMAPLNLLANALIGNSPEYALFLRTGEHDGSADIAGIAGLNFAPTTPEVPLPAAAPLFLAGLAGLGFARARRKKA